MSVVVFLAGPIEYWWDENWETEQHWLYNDWRNELSKALVDQGYLVYRPHEAFKGSWDERAQEVNNAGLDMADIVLVSNFDPRVPADGTDAECRYVMRKTWYGKRKCEGQLLRFTVPDTREEFPDQIDYILKNLASYEKFVDLVRKYR